MTGNPLGGGAGPPENPLGDGPGDAYRPSGEMSVHREIGGVQVIEVYGEIDLATISILDEALDMAIEALQERGTGDGWTKLGSSPCVILDLCPVEFLDSHGVGALLGYQGALKDLGGELLVAAEPGEVMKILKLTGVDELFRVFESLEEALAATTC